MKIPAILAMALAAGAAGAQEWPMKGQHSGVQEPTTAVVRDAQTWKALWGRHGGRTQPLPEVDFSREMVVAVFLGRRSTGGYALEVELKDQGQQAPLVVEHREVVPGHDEMKTQAFTSPFQMIKISAGYAAVKFEALPSKVRGAACAQEWPIEGGNSGVFERMAVAVRDAQAWRALWAQHGRNQYRPRPAPAVDFSREMVIAVFAGAHSNGGFQIETQLEDKGPSLPLTVRYKVTHPSGYYSRVITQPFKMFTVSNSYPAVHFEALPASPARPGGKPKKDGVEGLEQAAPRVEKLLAPFLGVRSEATEDVLESALAGAPVVADAATGLKWKFIACLHHQTCQKQCNAVAFRLKDRPQFSACHWYRGFWRRCWAPDQECWAVYDR